MYRNLTIRFFAAFVVWLQLSAGVSAQQLVLKTYDRSSGLPSDFIMNMFQDRDGFIWFCTDRGICRYNGKSFTTFTIQNGLPDNFVQYCYQDSKGYLWFGIYEHGVVRFDGKRFESYSTKDGLIGNTIKWIAEDQFGRMYFCSDDAISILFKGKFYPHKNFGLMTKSLPLRPGIILYSENKSLYQILPTNDGEFHSRKLVYTEYDGINYLGTFGKPSSSWGGAELYIGYSHSAMLYKFTNDSTLIPVKAYEFDNYITGIVHEEDSILWCGTLDKGVYKITPAGITNFSTQRGLLQMRVETLIRDYEGNIWISVFGSGAQKLTTTSVMLYRQSDGLPSNQVTALFEDSKKLMWIGTNTGLAALEHDSIHRYATDEKFMREVRSIAEDSYGNYYFGTFEYLFGPATYAQLLAQQPLKKIRVGYGVSGIVPVPDPILERKQEPSVVLASYGEGVKHYVGEDSMFFITDKELCSNVIEKVVSGKQAAWFLSQNGGATRWESNQYKLFSKRTGLPTDAVFSVYEEPQATKIWFGTDIGISRVADESVTSFNATDGIIGAPVLGIFPDCEHQTPTETPLWIVTQRALHYYQNNAISLVGVFSFGQVGALSINSIAMTAGRVLWLGTPYGAYTINISAFHKKSMFPKVVITGIVQDTNILYAHNPCELTNGNPPALELQYKQNNFTIEYAGLSFINESGTTFRFMLSPLDQVWSQQSSDNHVQFRNLDNGEYTFYVEAINSDGIHSSQPAAITFRILPPFWKRWWFLTLGGMLLFGIVAGAIRYFSQRKLLKQVQELERQQELQRERDRISRDLHDNVGAQMVSIISGLELAGRYSDSQGQQVKDVLDSLHDDARTTMALLRETIWALQSSDMEPEKFSGELEQYVRKQLRYHPESKLQFHANICSKAYLRPVEAINVLRIVQEALTNSIKHAKPTIIEIHFLVTAENVLNIQITNDGSLPHREDELSGGKGLPNMERRAREIGGTFRFSQNKERITRVEISVPLRKS